MSAESARLRPASKNDRDVVAEIDREQVEWEERLRSWREAAARSTIEEESRIADVKWKRRHWWNPFAAIRAGRVEEEASRPRGSRRTVKGGAVLKLLALVVLALVAVLLLGLTTIFAFAPR